MEGIDVLALHLTTRSLFFSYDEDKQKALMVDMKMEEARSSLVKEKRDKFASEILSLPYEKLLTDSSGLGELVLIGGYHSGEAFKQICAEETEKIRKDPDYASEPWAAQLYDKDKREVVPRRRVMIYRYTAFPAVWDDPDLVRAGEIELRMTEAELDKGRMEFGKLLSSTDNMFLKASVEYDANTPFLLIMIFRSYFDKSGRPDRASGRASNYMASMPKKGRERDSATRQQPLMTTASTKSYNDFRYVVCLPDVNSLTCSL